MYFWVAVGTQKRAVVYFCVLITINYVWVHANCGKCRKALGTKV